MTSESYERKLAELDDLLNDPNVPFHPSRIWQLMAEISGQAGPVPTPDLRRRPVAAE
jgi:hypothetical protein